MIFITRQVPVMSCATILFTCYYSRKLSVNCICWTVGISFCCVLCYMLDDEMFPQYQLISHGEHFVSIMKTLSSAFIFCTPSTKSALTIINTDSGVWLTEWHRSIVYREILEWWFFHRLFTFRIGYYCILLKYRH